ncbi:hypothetical protein G6F50_015366 [Rhizopus delemar]|uniref:Lipoyl-binding domain-containing protein n=1 Tax=Rhizopus delemar TaxID=936053 RepID=A0A9P6XYA2_9FUNG|nr:hypothetical protein G6F50_015366 [Rhizopus delemar]
MDIEVVMPAIGAGTTQGRILQWLKQSGDTVKVGDILAEIETDKAVIELEAVDSGVLDRIHVEAGDTAVPVGDVIATLLAEQGARREAPAPSAEPPAPVLAMAAPPAAKPAAAVIAPPATAVEPPARQAKVLVRQRFVVGAGSPAPAGPFRRRWTWPASWPRPGSSPSHTRARRTHRWAACPPFS